MLTDQIFSMGVETLLEPVLVALFGWIVLIARGFGNAYLGVKKTEKLSQAFSNAIQRAAEASVASGSKEPVADVIEYMQDMMGGTISKLEVSNMEVRKRASAEVAVALQKIKNFAG